MKKKLWFSAAALAVLAAFIFVACSKQSQSNPAVNEPAATQKIETLAQRFTQPIGSDFATVKQQYASLNESDLKIFWQDVYRITHKTQTNTPDENSFITMISGMNEKSKQQYGLPFNKASNEQLAVLFEAEYNTNRKVLAGRVILPPPPPGDCPTNSYPLAFYPTPSTTPSPAAISFAEVKDPSGEDPNGGFYPCSALEYTYTGQLWSAVCAITPLGSSCIYWMGGWPWKARREGTNTKLFAPKGFVIAWFGSFPALNDHVRLSLLMDY